MRRVPALLTLLLLLVGTTALTDPTAGGEPPPTPEVEVTDPGATPRTSLRLDATEGDEFTTAMTIAFALEQEVDGETMTAPIPPIRYDLGFSVDQVNRAGQVTYTFTVEQIEAVDDGTVDSSVLDRIADELEPLADLEGEAKVSARGAFIESDIEIPDDLDATARASVEQFSQQLSGITVPYPRARVGVGATWTATTTVRAGGIDSQVVSSYELRQLEGNAYTVAIEYEQTAEPQDVDLPGVPSDANVSLEEYDVSGSGELTGDLTSPVGSSGTISAAGEQAFSADGEELRQSVTFEVTVESRREG